MQAVGIPTAGASGAGAGGLAAAGSGGLGTAGQGGLAATSGGGGAAGQVSAAGSGGVGAAGQGGAAGAAPIVCKEADKKPALGIASVALNAPPPLKLMENVQLLGEGLELTLAGQQNVTAGLRWRGDRMYLTADAGFWDIAGQAGAVWKGTNSVIVWGVRAGDLDGDGDQDAVVLTMELNTMPPAAGGVPMPFLSRLTAWERTPAGLMERAEVMRTPEMRIGMPYALGDVDADGDLDVVGFEANLPKGYRNDGAFEFAPIALAASAAGLEGKGALLLDVADRNQDGSPDLLMVVGNVTDNQADNSMLVMLGDGAGKFGAPGPMTAGRTPLVPHGPDGSGIGMADVTGDGLVDIVAQAAEGTADAPILRVYASTNATTVGPAMELSALGFEFADVDEDGKTDIVTTMKGRLSALLSRGDGKFEPRDLGISIAEPQVKDFVVDPGAGAAPATVHVLYNLESCPACGAGCSGQCLFDTCVACLSDADCKMGRCEGQVCVP